MTPRPFAGRNRDARVSPMRGMARGATVGCRAGGDRRVDSAADIRILLPVTFVTPEFACAPVSPLVLRTVAKEAWRPRIGNLPMRLHPCAGGSHTMALFRRRRSAVTVPDTTGGVWPGGMRRELRVWVTIGAVERGMRGSRMLRDPQEPCFLPAARGQPEPVAEKAPLLIVRQGAGGRQSRKDGSDQQDRGQSPIPHRISRPR